MKQTFETTGPLSVSVRVPAGRVRIRTTQQTAAVVETSGEKSPEDLRIELLPGDHGDQLVIEHTWKRAWGLLSFGQGLEVDIEVPEGSSVTCDTGSADIQADGPLADLTLRTASGDVRFAEVRGDLTVKNGSGDVTGGKVGHDLSIHSASGDINVEVVEGDVVARTASGDVAFGSVDGDLHVTVVSGDVRVRSLVGGKAYARTVSGDIEVGVAEGTGVYLDLGSTTGDVRSDLEPTTGAGRGDALLDLEASSLSGDVRVRRAPARDTRSA